MFVGMRGDWKAAMAAWVILFQSFSAVVVYAASESEDLTRARGALEKLVEKNRISKSLILKFKSRASGPDGETGPYWKGTLLAADSGRFRLEQKRGDMVSNGRVLWQYAPENNQVIVRNAPAVPPSGAVGAALPNWLSAQPLRAVRTPEGLRVALDPTKAELDSLWVVLDAKNSSLRGVETVDAAGNRVEYRVLGLKFESAIRSKDFTFDIPKGTEVVDMR